MYKTFYEKNLIKATKEFALANNIPFTAMTALMIINTIRQVRRDMASGVIVNKKIKSPVKGTDI
jgi:hypothetical protein